MAVIATTACLLAVNGPANAAKPAPGPQPIKPPTALAVHTSDLAGSTAVVAGLDGAVSGTVSLEVDQTSTGGAIVLADIALPPNFTWNDGDVTATSDEDGGSTAAYTYDFSGGTLTVRGSFTDTDSDGAVEFTITVDNADITTTETTAGSYALSSQYRTNPTRKVKEKTWSVTTPDMITLTTPI